MKKIYIIILLAFIVLAVPNYTFAIDANTDGPEIRANEDIPKRQPVAPAYSYIRNPLQAESIEQIVVTVVDLAIVIGVIFAVFMFIWIGFKFVMARGNDSALKEAKEWFMYAVIGTAILISAKVIVEVVKNTFISAGVVKQELFNKKI